MKAVAAAALFAGVLWIPQPAYAAKDVVATINGSATCPAGQVRVGGEFKITATWQNQKIEVHTETSTIPLTPTSYASGIAIYRTAFDAPLNQLQPATARINESWSGTFAMVAATCQQPLSATMTTTTSACGNAPQVIVAMMNPNPIMVAYRVSGSSLYTQSVNIPARQNARVSFTGLTAGRSYAFRVEGNDGTSNSADATVPLCASAAPAASLPSSSPTAVPTPTPTPTPTATPLPPTPTPALGIDPRELASIKGNPLATDGTRTVSNNTSQSGWARWIVASIVVLAGFLGLVGLRLLRSRNN